MFQGWNRASVRMTFAVAATAATVIAVEAGGPLRNPFRQETSVEKLAKQLDHLEREFQYTGRVMVKTPDVWGQARLTAHREEFEREMAKQLDKFTPTLNAEIAIADQAFLSQALAISGVARGLNGEPLSEPDKQDKPTNIPQYIQIDASTLNQLAPSSTGQQPAAQGQTDDQIANGNLKNTYNITANGPNGLFTATRNTNWKDVGAFGLEPEIILDQRKRYLDHLHEIRRMNEGDDTADSPGYSLNLVRLPVSIIPGDHTRENYGAEVTMIAEPHVTEELLPTTFRQLVINDLIDQLSLPIVKVLNLTWDTQLQLEQELAGLPELKSFQKTVLELLNNYPTDTPVSVIDGRLLQYQLSTSKLIEMMQDVRRCERTGDGWRWYVARKLNEIFDSVGQTALFKGEIPSIAALNFKSEKDQKSFLSALHLINAQDKSLFRLTINDELENSTKQLRQYLLDELTRQHKLIGLHSPRERRSRYPIPASEIPVVFGTSTLAELVLGAFRTRDRHSCQDRMSLANVQGYLRNELEFSYDYLASIDLAGTGPGMAYSPTWMPTVDDIRIPEQIENRRHNFYRVLPRHEEKHRDVLIPDDKEVHVQSPEHPTEALAWAILVESALLNQQLNADLKQVSQDPNCGCVYAPDCEFQFYGPNPPLEARQAFIQYVKCRWPIRVFALDPVTQQQNVADTFSLRREGQLAIALAFSQGRANAQSLTRYMRRIEQDIRTVSLNNTHVGFGAGDDTFGWRFYPRVQTPDVESNLKTIGRDLIWGGPNRDAKLKRWRIEPGMRECVALVVMPSFIKHVRFDVRTNWFQLVPCATSEITKKGQNGVTVKHTVEWSRELQAIENAMAACIQDEHLYRPGEVERMIKRGQQLSRQMPLNTMYAQVPYENTLGGFEMFSSGVTDLAPELVGFYGSPGVDPVRPTTLFLVGDNFSIHDTRVLAGNQMVDSKMLSREVMQVDIPANVRIDRRLCVPREKSQPCCNADCNDLYVEVRLATPYGVSSPLYVPVVQENGLQQSKCCQPAAGNGATEPTPLGNPLNCQPEKPKLPPQALWGRAGLAVQYLLAKNSTGKLDEPNSQTLSQSPHVIKIVSPADRLLPATTTDKPARIRIWIHSVNGNQLVPSELVLIEDKAVISGGAFTLETGLYQKLHEALRKQLLSLYRGQIPPSIQTLNVELKGDVVTSEGSAVAVDGSLPVTIEVIPPGP